MADYELYHAGVKGMKWGVRKKRESSGSRPAKKSRLDRQAERVKADFKKINKEYNREDAVIMRERKMQTQQSKKMAGAILATIGTYAVGSAASIALRSKGNDAVASMVQEYTNMATAAVGVGSTIGALVDQKRLENRVYKK